MGGNCSNTKFIQHSQPRKFRNSNSLIKVIQNNKIMIKSWRDLIGTRLIDYQCLENCSYHQYQFNKDKNEIILDHHRGFIQSSKIQQKKDIKQPQSSNGIHFKIVNQNQIQVNLPKNQQILKKITHKQEYLGVGEIIYMGQWATKIKAIFTAEDILEMKSQFQEFKTKRIIEENTEEDLYCKFCYQGSSVHNPLIKPCKCNGSIEGIHRQCVSQWIIGQHLYKLKQNIFSQHKTTFQLPLKRTYCQICKTSYDKFIYYQLLSRIFPNSNINQTYVILESARRNFIHEIGMPKTFICHKFSNKSKKLSFGRSSKCDIKPQTNSVSKNHATLVIKNNSLCVIDQGSRFGTFKVCNSKILEDQTGYEIGRIYIEIHSVKQTITQEYTNIIQNSINKKRSSLSHYQQSLMMAYGMRQ